MAAMILDSPGIRSQQVKHAKNIKKIKRVTVSRRAFIFDVFEIFQAFWMKVIFLWIYDV